MAKSDCPCENDELMRLAEIKKFVFLGNGKPKLRIFEDKEGALIKLQRGQKPADINW